MHVVLYGLTEDNDMADEHVLNGDILVLSEFCQKLPRSLL